VVNELAKDPNKRSVQKINIFCCDKNIKAPLPLPSNSQLNVSGMSIFRQVHLRGNSVLLEMVGRSVRGDADHRKRPCGVRAVGVHRRRVGYER